MSSGGAANGDVVMLSSGVGGGVGRFWALVVLDSRRDGGIEIEREGEDAPSLFSFASVLGSLAAVET